MSEQSINNKRIVKNTMLLYFRMLFMMVVSLYTSRVIINALGIDDYGIYSVVGGVVMMFNILSTSLSASISRFLTFELGRNEKKKLSRIFSSAVTIQIGLAILIIILAETIGLWFLNSVIVIPENRIDAANWVYQFSVFTFAVNLISIPYNAAIIAHEKMSVFAYISILEVVGKLVVAYLILISPIDKLIFYGLLLSIVAIIVRIIYGVYCKCFFEECTYKFYYDSELLMNMFGFAGWNFIGAASGILRDQGGNIVINIFCGPAVNAARGIASQVNAATQGFVSNFQMALNPQITKNYASGNYDYMMKLVFQGARLSYYILLILSLPIIFNTHYILTLWLGVVPQHTVLFVQLVLVFAMSESLANPLITAMLATGKIRNYQLVVGCLQILNLPISYMLLRYGFVPESVIMVAIFISVLCEMARLYMLKGMINLSIKAFMNEVYLNVIGVTLIAIILPFIVGFYLGESLGEFMIMCLITLLSVSFSIYFVGCSREERLFIKLKICEMISKVKKYSYDRRQK